MDRVPLQPALPWRRLGRDLLHRAPLTEPQPIFPEASEKRHRLRDQTLLCTFYFRDTSKNLKLSHGKVGLFHLQRRNFSEVTRGCVS